MRMKKIFSAVLALSVICGGAAPFAAELPEMSLTANAEDSDEEKYTLKELDFSDLLGVEGAKIVNVERTRIGTYILIATFPGEYEAFDSESHEYIKKEDNITHFAVVDENKNFIIPWFESHYGGRGARYLTYSDGVYNLMTKDTLPWKEYLNGSFCEYFGEDGKPLFEHEDWLCAGKMENGAAWVGVADNEIKTYENGLKYRDVKEFQLIDKTGKVLKTTTKLEPQLGGGYDLSEILYDSDELEYMNKLNEKGFSTLADCVFYDGLKRVHSTDSDKWGYANESGEIVIPAEYKYAYDFVDGSALVQKNDETNYYDGWGVIDTEGKALTEFVYTNYYNNFSEDGYAMCEKTVFEDDGKYHTYKVILDTKGNECELPFNTEEGWTYKHYNDGWFLISRDKNGEKRDYSLINWDGNKIELPEKYDYIINSDGVISASTLYTDVSPERRYFYISSDFSLGDVNDDGKIDATDATLVLVNYSLLSTGEKMQLTESQQKAADVNGDGKIDASDATMILQYYSYLSTGGDLVFKEFMKQNG